MLQEPVAHNNNYHKGNVVVFCALLLAVSVWHNSHSTPNSQLKAEAPMNLFATLPGQTFKARCTAYLRSAANSHGSMPNMRPYLRSAAWSGAWAGCRGSSTCMRAVGLYFSTSTGNTAQIALS